MKLLLLSLFAALSLHAAQMRFAFVGDWQPGQPHKDVSDMIKAWQVEFIIGGGDLVYTSTTNRQDIDASVGRYWSYWIPNYRGIYATGAVSRYTNFYPVLGNHDLHATTAGDRLPVWKQFFGLTRDYYDFNRGLVYFTVLSAGYDNDNHVFEPDGVMAGSVQGLWISNRLVASTNIWKIAVSHQPPYTSYRSIVSGNTNLDSNGTLGYVNLRWPVLTNVDVFLSGHVHLHERIQTNGVVYWIDGRGGRDMAARSGPIRIPGSLNYYTNDFGATLVNVTESNMTLKAYTRRGTLIDSVTLTK